MNPPDVAYLLESWLPVQMRILALVFTAPIIGSRLVPFRVRVLLALCVAWVILPAIPNEPSISNGVTAATVFGSLAGELCLGALMGLSLRVMLAAAQLVGELIENVSGMNLFRAPDNSQGDAGLTPLSKLFYWTTLVAFIAAGGVNQLFNGVIRSFEPLPPGQLFIDHSLVVLLSNAVSQSFAIGCQAALPGIIALVISSLVLGLVQRGMPQLGGLQTGFSLRSIAAILITSVLLVVAPWVVLSGIERSMAEMTRQDAFRGIEFRTASETGQDLEPVKP